MKKYCMALDQGTTGARACVFDRQGQLVGIDKKEFQQYYPKPGWVEHDPFEILDTQIDAARSVIKKCGIDVGDIDSIGIANQRETTVVWNRYTGKPVGRAIVWQCRRTRPLCEQLKKDGLEPYIRSTTGLLIDAYFSATKIKWMLEWIKGAKINAQQGDLIFGTIDSWLLWNLTKPHLHFTDETNASRTMLYDIKKRSWDRFLFEALEIPASMAPEVCPSSHEYGHTDSSIFGESIPIGAMVGDQQAALFGQHCWTKGRIKNTYGTGCFVLMHTGDVPVESKNGLLTTCAASTGPCQYALEGSVFTAGAIVQWLRDELGIIENAEQTESMAFSVEDANGVVIVPAFNGLGAPYWDMKARGLLIGITRGVNRNHIVRAALESIAWQSADVISLMAQESDMPVHRIKADGGASENDFLMQFQADVAGVCVDRPLISETTAWGAALLSGLTTGFYNLEGITEQEAINKSFSPAWSDEKRDRMHAIWEEAVKRSMGWTET